jgi:hypothetical protein
MSNSASTVHSQARVRKYDTGPTTNTLTNEAKISAFLTQKCNSPILKNRPAPSLCYSVPSLKIDRRVITLLAHIP